ncbi:substrate-binding domain-containing protein [Streptacidiphilus fuscans]|uniref:DeoR/GlpR family transcriptional regulator n=1 Tax=Streptacidiphilus fuscans TaxID=2789292 RepID=A0A931BDM4_9ACTN|nr:substrate-binding domain-containing protein [Streptacidiphilus fuscans]MBF9071520.1 DeoR/GlpR family transcriptional regulator [Streptacidiphilus fuscans]
MRATAETRHRQILDLLSGRTSLRVGELAVALGVSVATARRDVEAMSVAGLVQRAHGQVSRHWPVSAAVVAAAGVPPSVGSVPGFSPGSAPGPAAAALPGATANPLVIGMLVPVADYYYAEVVRGAREAAARAGARLVLGISHYSPEADRVQLAALVEGGAAGLLLTPSWASGRPGVAEERRILELGVPTVLLERRVDPGTGLAELDRVCTAHAEGAGLAVRHLAELGRRRIGLLVRTDTPTAHHLRAGYLSATAALGLEALPLDLPGPKQGGGLPLHDLVESICHARLDAALVHTDEDALRLLQALHQRGLRVPDDLALVAYDDEVAALADVPLTAVAPPKRRLGATAVALLLDRLRTGPAATGTTTGTTLTAGAPGARPNSHLDLLPSLRVRASCGEPVGGAVVAAPASAHMLR